MYTLTYMDRKGAGILKRLDGPSAAKLLPKIKAEANLRDDDGNRVGGVDDAHLFGTQDDRRVRWLWWYDKDIEVAS